MANAWDDFWGNLTKPIKGGEGGYQAYGNWDSKKDPIPGMTMGGVSNSPINAGQRVGLGSGRSKSIQALNTSKLPGMQEDTAGAIRGKFNSNQGQSGIPPMLARPQEEDPLDKLNRRRAELEAMLDEDFTGDPEMDAMVEQAYSSALSNISGARSQANDNFAKSDANLAALSAGHVREIETKDRDAIGRIAGEYQTGLNQTFDSTKQGLQDDRSAELQEKTAMLQRLGIQEAGLGDAGQDESDAIEKLSLNQAGAMRQAQGYQAADMTRNVEQAQSQASAGVERRSNLNRDLQGILGKLNESESSVNSEKAMAMMQNKQSQKKDYINRMGTISDSISEIDDRIDSRTDSDRDYALELRKAAEKNSGGGGVLSAVGTSLRNRGVQNPDDYMQAYADVSSTETFNAAVDGDKKLWLTRKMKAKYPQLDAREIQAVVLGVENYGTDKL